MKQSHRSTRIFILCLLAVSVLVPIVVLSGRIKHLTSDVSKETDALKLNSIEQEDGEGLKEPTLEVYKDEGGSTVSFSTYNESGKSEVSRNPGSNANLAEKNGSNHKAKKDNQQSQQEGIVSTSDGKEEFKQATVEHDQNARSLSRKEIDLKIQEMKDQVIRAKAYLNFAPPNSNSHLVKELKLRIKELERAMGDSTKVSELSRRALQRMRAMEASLLKASHVYPECSAMAKKLRAMMYNAEEQVRTQKNQASFLVQLAGRTTPKGLHCLSMRLTNSYFALQPEEREFPGQHKLHDPDLYHFAVFSDNILACAAVVDSIISTAMEPEKIVIHILTDSLNLPAIIMWFLLNPLRRATIQVQSIDSFDWMSTKYGGKMQWQSSSDPRYASPLNHLRFYLPEIFPALKKIVLLDHDVIVQRDLSGLWSVDMKDKVNGAVVTCREDEPSFRRMNMLINFSEPMVGRRFDVKACNWAFGMNLFDLQKWRRRNLTEVYHNYLQLVRNSSAYLDSYQAVIDCLFGCTSWYKGSKRPLWKAGSLPIGWVTFYNQTVGLDRRWHVLGLGHHADVKQRDIEQAAVIHYDGVMKPWLDIGLEKYKQYWRKHVKYDHPYLQQCNIHD
ncbi:hypothetical protein RJ639_035041 [Escallonia herrerae]|uniref:Hexosyltransferase n=1 Tax=Escallonia herrerae TaxID=1293975 RepID=A0AA88WV86_9ASTE|nr:hypothetical protein RJ639_035041 [Escallonia herrerae]